MRRNIVLVGIFNTIYYQIENLTLYSEWMFTYCYVWIESSEFSLPLPKWFLDRTGGRPHSLWGPTGFGLLSRMDNNTPLPLGAFIGIGPNPRVLVLTSVLGT